jgi:hypothetical protein
LAVANLWLGELRRRVEILPWAYLTKGARISAKKMGDTMKTIGLGIAGIVGLASVSAMATEEEDKASMTLDVSTNYFGARDGRPEVERPGVTLHSISKIYPITGI